MFAVTACQKNDNQQGGQAQLQILLIDNPPGNVAIKEVWVDVRQIEIMPGDTSKPILLSGVHAGVYNLLELTNGKDTLLADASIPAGSISQIRLILGDNNYIVTSTGEKLPLKTPSAQQSGLKVQVHQDVLGGSLYRLTLDFDVARSIVVAGNSGNIILKPVLRLISFAPSGGNIRGVVVPDSIKTAVIALNGVDTIGSTFTSSGNYFLKDVPAGSYTLSFIPVDTSFRPTQKTAVVTLGQTTLVDTVRLQR
ncbi:MAG: DUF4382 domain-containing protein [Bacteroidota bacterium]|nr:DUF4382 domain-containing protein [Bacteroidota bacterium]